MSQWLQSAKASISAGASVITFSDNQDFSSVRAGDAVMLNGQIWQCLSGTRPDSSQSSTLTLAAPWPYTGASNVKAYVFRTTHDLLRLTSDARRLTDITKSLLAVQADILTSAAETVTVPVGVSDITGEVETILVTPWQYLVNQMQSTLGDLSSAVTAAVKFELAKVRYSKIDNPVCHLFKKNKLSHILSGSLSWVRESGATFIDRNGVLRYSPSLYATNLLSYSNDLSHSVWIKTNCAIIDKVLTPNAGSFQNSISRSLTLSVGDRYTLSFNAIANGHDVFYIQLRDLFLSGWKTVRVDLKSKRLISDDLLSELFEFQDRYSLSFTPDKAGGSIYIGVASPQDITLSSSGDGGILFSAIQLEKSIVANAYVQTVATAPLSGKGASGISQAREESKGWLIEPDSTNLIAFSQKLQTSPWEVGGGQYHATLISANGLAPDGTNTAELYGDTDIASQRYVRMTFSGLNPSTAKTASFFVKADTSTVIGFRMASASGTAKFRALSFNTLTKTFSEASGSLSEITWGYSELANGWFRIWMAIAGGFNNTSFDYRIYPCDASNAAAVGRAYIWGAQLEEKAGATSYIPTGPAQATRLQDSVFAPGSRNAPNLNADSTVIGCFRPIFDLTGATNYPLFAITAVGKTSVFLRGLQVYGAAPSLALSYANSIQKSAASVDYRLGVIGSQLENNKVAGIANGVIGGFSQDLGAWVDTMPDKITFGQGSDLKVNTGFHIQDFRIYDFALNSAEVAFLAGE
jgi:hypothetical protein